MIRQPADREHVTRAIYRDPGAWHIADFTSRRDLGRINLSVDTVDDFAAFEDILARMSAPHWSYGLDDILTLAGVAEPAGA